MTKTPEGIEVIEGPQPGKRRRFTAEEKRRLVAEASEPGSSVSLVAKTERGFVEPVVSLAAADGTGRAGEPGCG